jgi:hypothetical protein
MRRKKVRQIWVSGNRVSKKLPGIGCSFPMPGVDYKHSFNKSHSIKHCEQQTYWNYKRAGLPCAGSRRDTGLLGGQNLADCEIVLVSGRSCIGYCRSRSGCRGG